MTKKEKLEKLIDNLRNLKGGDEEYCHGEADRLLLEYINNKEVTQAFDEIGKWYA